jgi:hypothetical protein
LHQWVCWWSINLVRYLCLINDRCKCLLVSHLLNILVLVIILYTRLLEYKVVACVTSYYTFYLLLLLLERRLRIKVLVIRLNKLLNAWISCCYFILYSFKRTWAYRLVLDFLYSCYSTYTWGSDLLVRTIRTSSLSSWHLLGF